jgi:hypothetical protein
MYYTVLSQTGKILGNSFCRDSERNIIMLEFLKFRLLTYLNFCKNRFYSHGNRVALGSTQPLTETSTRDISWGVKAAGAWG